MPTTYIIALIGGIAVNALLLFAYWRLIPKG